MLRLASTTRLVEWPGSDDNSPSDLVDWTRSAAIVPNGLNTIRVVTTADLMECYINSALVIAVRDSSHTQGEVALYITGLQEVAFDNMSVATVEPLLKPAGQM